MLVRREQSIHYAGLGMPLLRPLAPILPGSTEVPTLQDVRLLVRPRRASLRRHPGDHMKKPIEEAIDYSAKAAALREEVNASDDMTDETEHLALVAAFYGAVSEAFVEDAVEGED